ncbi:MAG: hypothetical protein IJ514_00215 [Clostridia bacterium]|nr:hypothetical protein [Clostridia bacterium]
MMKKTNKTCVFLLCAFLTFSLFGCDKTPSEEGTKPPSTPRGEEPMTGNWYDDENFEPVIRFTVTADTHVGSGTTDYYYWTQELFAQQFQHGYSYASTQEYDKLDAFIDVGDWVDHGYPGEYENFVRVYKENIREGTQFIPVLAGHEQIYGTVEDYTTNLRMDTGVHSVINGYHLIGVSNYQGSNTSPIKGFEWLEEQVREAYNDDPYKPIFVFQHHPINDTIPSHNDNGYSEQYHAIYKNYPNVILFTAHTHIPGSEPANILQHDYTSIGVAAMAYNEQHDDYVFAPWENLKAVDGKTIAMSYATDEEHKGIGEMYIVEADEQGRTRVLLYDIYQNGMKADIDGEGTMAYYFEDVTDKSTWLYTSARWEEDSAPQFGAHAAVEIVKNANGSLSVSFPQAKGKYGVFCYDMFLTNEQTNETVSHRIYSLQWNSIMPTARGHEFTGLTVGAQYTLSIEPVSSFAKYGKPLTVTFTAS